jgi:Zn-dependent M28 family amino/carboxypeptidase
VEGQAPGPSTSGCEAEDFAGFERGQIALVRRGTCTFQVKVENAEAAGASAVVIMNEGTPDRTERFGGALSRLSAVPVVGIPFEQGRLLALQEPARFRVKVDVVRGTRTTHNVWADTATGSPSETVVVGAHLDSVPEGPGINDNASGSAAVLETALRVAQSGGSARRLRFAFWGAEELGLLGSRHHLDGMGHAERSAIVLYINLDMVGSANFGRFLQARSEELKGLQAVAAGAIKGFFEERGLPLTERLRGRSRGSGSDDASFARHGIPTLFLYTGAGEEKDGAAAALFGGTAGRPYDPCYHKACDGLENVDMRVLEEMTEALLHAVVAVSKSGEIGPK